ncbi:hypothetical protein TRFO_28297 [Tritrichomonas foetus]|uniref:Uncharacterized protein n=1 Tax=Tritrichomonas foetus TaxID=1144522 RepID=A0A1J4JYK9_9EUKA|nr:hypothetical protein TRFO_28297 [Tritrichomonas foetus]|eukprot:OHT04247.1 hypothetical protein TRFO_28297 [Tritrichomonas foetus]
MDKNVAILSFGKDTIKIIKPAEYISKHVEEIINKFKNENPNMRAVGQEEQQLSLFYVDRTFSIPFSPGMIPFSLFPNLVMEFTNIGGSLTGEFYKYPHLTLLPDVPERRGRMTISFHHIDEQIPKIEMKIQIPQQGSRSLAEMFAPILSYKIWKPIIEHISIVLGVDKQRIILRYMNEETNRIIYPFQSIEKVLGNSIDKSSGKFAFKGRFVYEILPVFYQNLEGNNQSLSEIFEDTTSARRLFVSSLHPSIMNSINNFQAKLLSSINKNNYFDALQILTDLIASEFHLDSNDNLIKIALMHILSSTLVDIYIPFVASVLGANSDGTSMSNADNKLYPLQTWTEFSNCCQNRNFFQNFNNSRPNDEDLATFCMNYFIVTNKDFVRMVVENCHKFMTYFILKPEDLKRPPINLNNFLGPVIYANSISVDEARHTILLTRGFVYIVNATINADNEEQILVENLRLDMHAADCFSIPLNCCYFLPVPDPTFAIAIIASKWARVLIKFKSQKEMANFAILFSLSKAKLENTTLYPLQVQDSSAQFSFMNNQIHAKVNVSSLSWDVYFNAEKVQEAMNHIDNLQITPNIKPSTFRLSSQDFQMTLLSSPIAASKAAELAINSSAKPTIKSYTNSWSYAVLNDMIFNFFTKASFEGLLLLKISDFGLAIAMNSKDLLQIQVQAFSVFISNFNVNDTPLLHYACLVSNNSGVVRFLIQHCKRSNNDNSKYFRSTLFYALRNPNISILQALIDSEFDVDQADSENVSPLIYCLKLRDLERAQLLLRNGASVHRTLNSVYSSALEYVIAQGDIQMMNLIMPYCGQQINAPNSRGEFVTHLCLKKKFFDGLRTIENLDEYFNPNMSSDQFPHPMHYILTDKEFDVEHLKALLRIKRINVNARDANGDTPLIHALKMGQAGAKFIRDIVTDPRCDVDEYDSAGKSALYIAVQNKDTENVKQLIGNDRAIINQPNKDGDTPLFCAIRNNCQDIVKLFIDKNIHPNQWYYQGALPTHIAPPNIAQILARSPNCAQKFRKFENP